MGEELIFRADVLIDAGDSLVNGEISERGAGIVADSRRVRKRHVLVDDVRCDRVQAVTRDDTARERRAIVERIGNRAEAAEVAGALSGSQNNAGARRLGERRKPLVTPEEERLVMNHRSTQGPAELVLFQYVFRTGRRDKEIARVEVLIAQELVGIAMKLVCPRLDLDIGVRARADARPEM